MPSWTAALAAQRRRLLFTLRHAGPRRTLAEAAWAYLRRHRFVLLRRPLVPEPGPEPAAGTGCEIWDHRRLAAWRRGRTDLPTEFFQDEIDGVTTCAVVRAGPGPAGLIWLYRPGDYSRFFRLAAGEAELNYGYVLPAHRRRGIFVALLTFACGQLGRAGYRTAWAAVHAGNPPSLAAFRAAGFGEVARLHHFLIVRPRFDSGRGPVSAAGSA